MAYETDNYHGDLRDLYDNCKKHMYYQATLIMKDGSTFDGIIENVDGDNITVLIGEDVTERNSEDGDQANQQRQYGGYGGPIRRYRRFRRRAFPLAGLAELALLPYIAPTPYPYYNPYYPYYSYYPY